MAVLFTSDTHFGDHRILRTARRPFATIAEHDAHLVAQWQATVGPDDVVWHLGDVAPGYTSSQLDALLAELPGEKHLITGNNDDAATRTHPAWASVHDYAEITEDGLLCILCHYPFRTWNQIGKKSINLHGHSHGKLKPVTRQFDVGVDPQGLRPRSIEEIVGSRLKR